MNNRTLGCNVFTLGIENITTPQVCLRNNKFINLKNRLFLSSRWILTIGMLMQCESVKGGSWNGDKQSGHSSLIKTAELCSLLCIFAHGT